jgi:hypothetical protein
MSTTSGTVSVGTFKSKGRMSESGNSIVACSAGATSLQYRTHLLHTIRAARASVGEGLNDDEFTRLLLLEAVLPTEAGFTFLSLSRGVVTLSVPQQDLAKWYPDQGWVAPEKESIAKAIAEKYGLSLCEPPDQASSFRFPDLEQAGVHHHLELATRRETVVIAHPKYLKVRLFRDPAHGVFYVDSSKPLELGPDLLQDLAGLYRR